MENTTEQTYNIEEGKLFRSKTQKVLMRIVKVDKEKNQAAFQVADSNFVSEGLLSNLPGLFKQVEAEEITQEQWDDYLKTYQEDIRAIQEEQEQQKLSDLDLTKQTVTLGTEDNPSVTLMKGHVDALTFDNAFKKEGWDGDLDDNPTEEDIKSLNEELEHLYGAPYVNEEKGTEGWRWDLTKDDPNAEPVTIKRW